MYSGHTTVSIPTNLQCLLITTTLPQSLLNHQLALLSLREHVEMAAYNGWSTHQNSRPHTLGGPLIRIPGHTHWVVYSSEFQATHLMFLHNCNIKTNVGNAANHNGSLVDTWQKRFSDQAMLHTLCYAQIASSDCKQTNPIVLVTKVLWLCFTSFLLIKFHQWVFKTSSFHHYYLFYTQPVFYFFLLGRRCWSIY